MEDCTCRREKIDFRENVYGFDCSSIKRLAMQEPLVDVVDHEQVVTEPCKLSTFNISEMTKADAAFTVSTCPWPLLYPWAKCHYRCSQCHVLIELQCSP